MCFRVSNIIVLFYRIFTLNPMKIISSNEHTNAVANRLCSLKTDALITYYGYEAEVHSVTTEDGYVLKVFRCYSKKPSSSKRKPVILQHGILITSDDFCINPPNQSLAYVLADAGYDVWLPNSRGNFYSRKHVHKSAYVPFGGFWDFSFHEMGVYDQPAVIDYVLQQTATTKLYYIGFSQGATSLMVLLSEKPEYNEKIQIASFLAPGGYVANVGPVLKCLSLVAPILSFFFYIRSFEIMDRNPIVNGFINLVCALDLKICNYVIDSVCGPSDNQRNNAIMPAFICRFPSGASVKQLLHFAQQVDFGFFGKYMTGWKIPKDYSLSQITAPLSIHYSTADRVANTTDVRNLMAKLSNIVNVQCIDEKFNHIDFLWGMYATSIVYSEILKIFKQYH